MVSARSYEADNQSYGRRSLNLLLVERDMTEDDENHARSAVAGNRSAY